MILADVHVLVYAHREDAPDHHRYVDWLVRALGGPEPFGVNDHILSGVLRVVTHPKVFDPPSPLEDALAFVNQVRGGPAAVPVLPGARLWSLFEDLCRRSGARGNLIPDAYFAALAIESGSRWYTTDRDYSRFDGLDWAHPLEET